MKSKTKVVVVGGGVVGVSALYHLAKKGWSDVVLVERKELTSGSTWHAAGLLPLFNMSYSVGQLHKYSVKFYQELQKETGQEVGFSNVSNIRLAETQDRMDEYKMDAGKEFNIVPNPEHEYNSLINDVTLWDVAAERQVQVIGEGMLDFDLLLQL